MKNTVIHFLLWSVFLNHPLYAQEAIQIEIDSAPVEVEIQKPATPREEEPPVPQTAEAPEPEEAPQKSSQGYGWAIGIGAVVAGVLAALGGGGGGGGGTNTPPQH